MGKVIQIVATEQPIETDFQKTIERILLKTDFEKETEEITLALWDIKNGKYRLREQESMASKKKSSQEKLTYCTLYKILKSKKKVEIRNVEESVVLDNRLKEFLFDCVQKFCEKNNVFETSATFEEVIFFLENLTCESDKEFILNWFGFTEEEQKKYKEEQWNITCSYCESEGVSIYESTKDIHCYITKEIVEDYIDSEHIVFARNETDAKTYYESSVKENTLKGAKVKNPKLIATTSIFRKHKEKLSNQDLFIVYQCAEYMGLLSEEDKKADKPKAIQYIKSRYNQSMKYDVLS